MYLYVTVAVLQSLTLRPHGLQPGSSVLYHLLELARILFT